MLTDDDEYALEAYMYNSALQWVRVAFTLRPALSVIA